MANALRCAALLVLATLLTVSPDADAYPATQGCIFSSQTYPQQCAPSSNLESVAGCVAAAFVASSPGSDWTRAGWINPFNGLQQGPPSCDPPNGIAAIFHTRTTPAPGYSANNQSIIATAGLTCPNGGALQGNVCVCPEGQTDTGTSCQQPESCPGGQFRELPSGPCLTACPEQEGNGAASYPVQGRDSGFCMPRYKLGGVEVIDSATGEAVQCLYGGTGITVCSDYGGGVSCYSENTYNLGTRCETSTDLPPDETPCSQGDLWCDKGPGNCPTGYTGGDFNGKAICVKIGEEVTATPRPKSRLDPPKEPPLPAPPSTLTTPKDGTSTGTNPADDLVVAIGPGANTTGGGGAGGGGTIEVDVEVCGLPGKPPCKIDETGTPEGTGFGDAQKGTIEGEATKVTDAITGIQSGTGAPDRSWGFSINFPTTCTPLQMGVPKWGTLVLDFCQWQPIAHDIMGLVWAAFTLWFCIGMVGRAVSGGA
jgi:hypothetical protein